MLKKTLEAIKSIGTGILAILGMGALVISILTWIYQVNASQNDIKKAAVPLQASRSVDSTQGIWDTNVERILMKLAINDSLQQHDIGTIKNALRIPR